MDLVHKLIIRFSSNKIGRDEFGNEYYEEKGKSSPKKRFVIYNGSAEPSKIPSEWHAWIHYTINTPPININTHKLAWQKIHLPNLTGTKHAFFPSGSPAKGGVRKKVSSDFEAWNPNQNN